MCRTHSSLLLNHDALRNQIVQKEFFQRTVVMSSFNLIEAYLNGIAWDYCHNNIEKLSKRQKDLIQDTYSVSIRDKLLKYPKIVCGVECISPNDIDGFLGIVKPFRDSLVHPSPFSAPDKFGGYDKLRKIYDLNEHVALIAVAHLFAFIKKIHSALHKKDSAPEWLSPITKFFEEEKISFDQSVNAELSSLID